MRERRQRPDVFQMFIEKPPTPGRCWKRSRERPGQQEKMLCRGHGRDMVLEEEYPVFRGADIHFLFQLAERPAHGNGMDI